MKFIYIEYENNKSYEVNINELKSKFLDTKYTIELVDIKDNTLYFMEINVYDY